MMDTGQALIEHNEKIVKYIRALKEQRDEINFIINKQEEEACRLQAEIEKNHYKLGLIGKGLAQRKRAKEQYDITIKEAETKYNQIVASTEKLLSTVCHNACNLENSLGKRIGTEGSALVRNEPDPTTSPNVPQLPDSMPLLSDDQQEPHVNFQS